ncbi:hypothetical protein FGO68_gene12423 [Halteria grandinella]|uniref:Uncharacterized protein n=1 Tax=Halteria grandinella TaxID=5974 RepID=A0A8J8P3H9_HALGN|nr:hypothetical protein FGO68_gene12423 [Halteria grandinella]
MKSARYCWMIERKKWFQRNFLLNLLEILSGQTMFNIAMKSKRIRFSETQIAVDPMFFSEFFEDIPAVSKYVETAVSSSSLNANMYPNIKSDGSMSS